MQDFLSCKKSLIFSARLARYVQDLMQDLMQDLASFARKILARLAYLTRWSLVGMHTW